MKGAPLPGTKTHPYKLAQQATISKNLPSLIRKTDAGTRLHRSKNMMWLVNVFQLVSIGAPSEPIHPI
jgi:hypothetical protein